MKPIPRRAVLRGIAGGAAVTIGLPLLEAMLDSRGGALAGGTPLPKRFVAFHSGNGVILSRWVPVATGAAWELTPQLLPLAPVKSYCSVLSGFTNLTALGYPHHDGMSGMWSGRSPIVVAGQGSYFGGRTLDQVAADAIAPGTHFRSLEVGVSKRVNTAEGPTLQFLSHQASLAPLPPEYSPRALWQRMFGVAPDDPTRAIRGGVLGAVAGDIQRLRTKVGAADRDRLDAHLASVESLQAQVVATPPPVPVCAEYPEPAEQNVDVGGVEPMQAVADAMSALLVHAFTCDLTRVASVLLTSPSSAAVYSHLGQASEHHLLTHQPVESLEAIHDAVVWNVQQFSNLLQQLAAVVEGTGTLLDRTVAVLGSDCSEGWTHGAADMPLVIAGGGGGALVQPGVHLRAEGRNLSDALFTALRVVAPLAPSFGGGPGASSTPVSELLA